MIGMKHSATVLSARSEFDAFLFALIGEEKNGMLLSVLSALARLDLDPWREAADLARMPEETAKRRLTYLIEALPNRSLSLPEPEMISTRLVALLPCAGSFVASGEKLPGAWREAMSCYWSICSSWPAYLARNGLRRALIRRRKSIAPKH
jgi:hypothetical protein